jgi:hypothetical protein
MSHQSFKDYIAKMNEISSKINELTVREYRAGAKDEVEVMRNPQIQNLTKLAKKVEAEFFGSDFCPC